MNRVSKKNVVTDTEMGGTTDSETEGSRVVDIGITVDVGDDGESPIDADMDIAVGGELEDGDLLAAADAASDPETDGKHDRRTNGTIAPAERETLEAADIDPETVADKEYSYRMLLDEGVDETIAATLRRRFSLPWSFESEGDLDRRSSEVRGLGDAEREWIAVSSDEDWQAFEYEHSEPIAVERERPSERPYPRPTPITAVTGVGPDDAGVLAEAGIRSAERLATVDAMGVANALDLNVLHVRTWRHNARELVD